MSEPKIGESLGLSGNLIVVPRDPAQGASDGPKTDMPKVSEAPVRDVPDGVSLPHAVAAPPDLRRALTDLVEKWRVRIEAERHATTQCAPHVTFSLGDGHRWAGMAYRECVSDLAAVLAALPRGEE